MWVLGIWIHVLYLNSKYFYLLIHLLTSHLFLICVLLLCALQTSRPILFEASLFSGVQCNLTYSSRFFFLLEYCQFFWRTHKYVLLKRMVWVLAILVLTKPFQVPYANFWVALDQALWVEEEEMDCNKRQRTLSTELSSKCLISTQGHHLVQTQGPASALWVVLT